MTTIDNVKKKKKHLKRVVFALNCIFNIPGPIDNRNGTYRGSVDDTVYINCLGLSGGKSGCAVDCHR